MAQITPALIRKARATKCDRYTNKLNLIVNLFHRAKEFEDFCIADIEFDPIRSVSKVVHKFIIFGKKKSFTCVFHADMAWIAFKRYIRNMITHECSICYEVVQQETLFCSQCCALVCLECYAKKLVVQRSAKCSMCNLHDPHVQELVEDFEETGLTVKETIELIKKVAKNVK